MKTPGKIALSLSGLTFAAAGCSSDAKKAAATAATGTAAAVSTSSDSPLFPSFEFGPYLAKDPAGTGGHHLAVEYGYVDLRKSSGGADPFDYRLRQVTGYAVDGSIPAKAQNGCAEATPASGTPAATGLAVTGPISRTLTFGADGFARDEDTDGKNPIDLIKTLGADFQGPGGAKLGHATGLKAPTTGVVQLAGAFDNDVTVNTVISDMNRNLDASHSDLAVIDYGDAKDYTTLVVTFYGGTAAKTKLLRCVLPPKGHASVTADVYKNLLPLRGLTAVFANVTVVTDAGNSIWTAAIAGSGGVDPAVP